VLEEQADPEFGAGGPHNHESAFEAGLALIADGLAHRVTMAENRP
jgi:hypothetical protein